MLPEGVQGRHTGILDDIDSTGVPLITVLSTGGPFAWMWVAWVRVAYGGETPHFTVLPWRLVLVSRIPHRQLLLEDLTDKSSPTGPMSTSIPCPHYLLWCLHCGLGGKMQPYPQCSTGLWLFGGHVPHNADNCLVHLTWSLHGPILLR